MQILIFFILIGYVYCNIVHYVEKNDTCLDIMKRYNIYEFYDIYNIDCNNIQKYTKIDIINNNMMIISIQGLENLINFYNLDPDVLDLTEEEKCSDFKKDEYIHKHVVGTNEKTCYDIMMMYNIFIDTLYEINPNIDCDNLNKNDIINIITDKSIIVKIPFSSDIITDYINDNYKNKIIHSEL